MSALRTPEGWDKLPFTVKNRRGLYARVLCLSHPFTFCPSPMKLMCFLCLQSELYGKVNYDEALDRFDVLVMPTTPYLATSHATPDATVLAKISKGLGQT
ncbi:hypothetical protein GGU11DRAFT_382919 [Lentinula aff. detonsa]|nr:hypothetical protein GGU11DRAFT_382919 [Lentinula aff. detonsa]